MSELLSCPFCGGEASVLRMDYGYGSTVWGVFCVNDSDVSFSHGHFIDNYTTEAEAITAWNARVERTCHDRSVDSSEQFYCSECECTVDKPLLWGELNYCPGCGRKVEQ